MTETPDPEPIEETTIWPEPAEQPAEEPAESLDDDGTPGTGTTTEDDDEAE